MTDKIIECSICGLPVQSKASHNAEPINDGRCCSECNDTVVVPRRLLDVYKMTKRDNRG